MGAASGSGGVGLDSIIGGIGAEGEFRALNELFMGEEAARGLETQASFRTFEGLQERRAGAVALTSARRTANVQVRGGQAAVVGQLGSTAGGLARYG